MKKAFTMIELIFVIVIIGILAAVAISKMAATRNDAKISNIVANAKISLGEFQTYYISQGMTVWSDANLTLGTVTDVPLGTDCSGATPDHSPLSGGTPLVLCDEVDGVACVTLTPDTTGVAIKAESGSTVCAAVLSDPAIVGMIGGTASGSSKVYHLGGAGVIH